MRIFNLYTYKNREEFETFYKQKEEDGYSITPFIFEKTKELLEEDPDSIIDISSLVQYLLVEEVNIIPAMNNFIPASEDTQFIIIESLSEKALDIFRFYFKEKVSIYPEHDKEKNNESNELIEKTIPFKRIHLYSYKDSDELEKIIQYLNDKKMPLISFSQIKDGLIKGLDRNIGDNKDIIYVDITSLVSAIKDNSNLIYYAEKLLIENTNLNIIIHNDKVDEALDSFRLVFKDVQSAHELIPIQGQKKDSENSMVKITDLTMEEVNKLIKGISTKLFGHKKFKDQLPSAFNNFILLNRLKEKKVFSIFLLGNTGLGKSEFANLLKNELNPNTQLTKVNFGNYSSQDSLNSLIGSPRGYIGSEEGELSKKIVKSKAGVILCDEFEKANNQIFNFFLELLEDGVFTDSLSREHDIDGYIIIFTSNLDKTRFYKEIPTELQSRIDLVCEFSPFTEFEKKEFAITFIDSLLEKIGSLDTLKVNLSPREIQAIKDSNVQSIGNIRDIKRELIGKVFKNVEYF